MGRWRSCNRAVPVTRCVCDELALEEGLMGAWRDTQLGAAAGVFFVVLTLIGDLVAGSPPSFDDPASKIEAFYLDHHRAVLVGVILTGIAAAGFVLFLSSLAMAGRAARQ